VTVVQVPTSTVLHEGSTHVSAILTEDEDGQILLGDVQATSSCELTALDLRPDGTGCFVPSEGTAGGFDDGDVGIEHSRCPFMDVVNSE
tara:strand:- start:17239 stop:17505 length:267 start_codon:yes stop_codon:yes gene_type:complete